MVKNIIIKTSHFAGNNKIRCLVLVFFITGWGMQMSLYIFLKRKWTEDENHLTNMLTYFGKMHYPVHLILFPEGTDLSESNKKRDRDYSEKNGLPINKYVMHPRTTGFVHCMEVLNETYNTGISVCDITIGYNGKITQGEKEVLQGWP